MGKGLTEKERAVGSVIGEKKLVVGLSWNCAAELKLLLSALLLLCSLATLLQFLPPRFSSADLRLCLAAASTAAVPPFRSAELLPNGVIKRSFLPVGAASAAYSFILMSAYRGGPKTFAVMGLASKPLLVFGHPTYQCEYLQEGANSSSVSATPILPDWGYGRVYTVVVLNCTFGEGVGVPDGGRLLIHASTNGAADRDLNTTDTVEALVEGPVKQGIDRNRDKTQHEALVEGSVIRTNSDQYQGINDNRDKSQHEALVEHSTSSDPYQGIDDNRDKRQHEAPVEDSVIRTSSDPYQGIDRNRDKRQHEAPVEGKMHSVDLSSFSSAPKYDYLYCGSPLYGDLSPQRVREWLAYHVRLFGGKSHFVIHDAGGVHPDVFEVLRPWIELGYVSLHDVRDQERFDGYYHNQFLIVNDCLHRHRFLAKWIFFFDLDEFIYIPGKSSLRSVMDSLKDYSQFTIEQMPMSSKLCLTDDYGKTPKKWGFEKLVYRDVKRGVRRDRKYVVQPRDVFATGVHMSQNLQGKTTHKTERKIKYFHYHGTIAERREPCRKLINATSSTLDGTPYVLDTTMRAVAPFVKRFELKTVGPRLQRTRQ